MDKVLTSVIKTQNSLLDELHEKNMKTFNDLGVERPESKKKFKTRQEIITKVKQQIPQSKLENRVSENSTSRQPQLATGDRGWFIDTIAGRGGGRGNLLGAIAGRGRGRAGGRSGRGDLLGAIAGRGRGRAGGGGDRGDILGAIAGRGRGGRGDEGNGNLMHAIKACVHGREQGKEGCGD